MNYEGELDPHTNCGFDRVLALKGYMQVYLKYSQFSLMKIHEDRNVEKLSMFGFSMCYSAWLTYVISPSLNQIT